jgi:hypothetical protein
MIDRKTLIDAVLTAMLAAFIALVVVLVLAAPGALVITAVNAVFPAAGIPLGVGSSLATTFILIVMYLIF